MGDRPDYEVERGSYWRSVENRRKAGIAAAVAMAVLGVAATIALSAGRGPEDGSQDETSRTITPAEETSETTAPTAGEDAPGEPGTTPGGSGQDGSSAGSGGSTPYVRAPVVAYRRNGALCVAAEDGTGERTVVTSADGVFSLSPDGSTIAVVETGSGTLSLVDVTSGAAVAVGPATQDTPSWAPDSAWLVYTAPGPAVMRVARSGSGAVQLFAGSLPSVSVADGTVVAAAVSGEMAVWHNGSLSLLPASGTITGLATNGTTVWCGSLSAEGGASLCTGTIGGSDRRVLIAAPQSTRAVTFSDLLLAPDGTQLLFAEHGDDGYSRMFVVPASGGSAEELSVRRDCYPLRWAADGGALLFIEGNAFQGDPTALMRVEPSGAARRLLVDGAGH